MFCYNCITHTKKKKKIKIACVKTRFPVKISIFFFLSFFNSIKIRTVPKSMFSGIAKFKKPSQTPSTVFVVKNLCLDVATTLPSTIPSCLTRITLCLVTCFRVRGIGRGICTIVSFPFILTLCI